MHRAHATALRHVCAALRHVCVFAPHPSRLLKHICHQNPESKLRRGQSATTEPHSPTPSRPTESHPPSTSRPTESHPPSTSRPTESHPPSTSRPTESHLPSTSRPTESHLPSTSWPRQHFPSLQAACIFAAPGLSRAKYSLHGMPAHVPAMGPSTQYTDYTLPLSGGARQVNSGPSKHPRPSPR